MSKDQVRTAADFSRSFKFNWTLEGYQSGLHQGYSPGVEERMRRPAIDALSRLGLVWQTQYTSKFGSLYVNATHFGPYFQVRIRISDHDLPAEVSAKNIDLDLRLEDAFPQSEEDLFAILSEKNPSRSGEFNALLSESRRLEGLFVEQFGEIGPYWQERVLPTTISSFFPLATEGANVEVTIAAKWWNGPTGHGVGYYNRHCGKNYRISLARGGQCDGKLIAVIWAPDHNPASQKRALMAALEEVKTYRVAA
jgi:hypothetical protein